MDTRQIESEVAVKAVRSSGPGGQNVNKVSTKIQLVFNVGTSQGLTDEERMRILEKLASRITSDGQLIITSDSSRSQHKNKSDAFDKLFETLTRALAVPKTRKPTKIPRAVIEKRLKAKKVQSEVKQGRKRMRF